METVICIKLLGQFDLLVQGKSVLAPLEKSKKGVLFLKTLILNDGQPVSTQELMELIWGETDNANPESAIKTLVSRLRRSLADASPFLTRCIVTEKGSYRWEPDASCSVDIQRFEQLCRQVDGCTALTLNTADRFEEILTLYRGDLTPISALHERSVNRSVYLHDLYIGAVHRYIELLKNTGQQEKIVEACRRALEIDAFEETLHLEMMRALRALGLSNAALTQYQRVVNMFGRYLGIQPSEQILSFYRELIKADLAAETNILDIQHELEGQTDNEGALVCDYSIFKEIYQIQRRNAERLETKIFIALVTVKNPLGEPYEPLTLDSIMNNLLGTLKHTLRKGDIVARYSPSQYTLLLPTFNRENGYIVFDRIKKNFYGQYFTNDVKLLFQIGNLEG